MSDYSTLRELGLCVRCRQQAPLVGVHCVPCSEEFNARQNSQYLSARAGQQCSECGEPSQASRCPSCAQERASFPSRDWSHRMQMEPTKTVLRERGFCQNGKDHGRRVDDRFCRKCRKQWIAKKEAQRLRRCEWQRQRRGRLLAQGLCAECARRPCVNGIKSCEECRERRLQRLRDKRTT